MKKIIRQDSNMRDPLPRKPSSDPTQVLNHVGWFPLQKNGVRSNPEWEQIFFSLDSSVTIDVFRMVLSILFHSQGYGSFQSIVFYAFQQYYTLGFSLQAVIVNKSRPCNSNLI